MNSYIKLAFWIIGYLAVSFTIGQMTQGGMQDWYQNLEKPSFNPPNYIFPIVWTILYIMTATAGWNLWRVNADKSLKIIFVVYTLMNWAWTPIFFGAHQIMLGFIWIIALSLVNLAFIIKAWQPARLSAILVIPLLAWTSFASLLSYQIWALNS
jgi:tryptophan-rich sensory protein